MTLTTFSRVGSIVLMMLPLAAGLAADSAAGKTAAKVLLEKGWKKPPGKDALVDHPRLEEPPLAGDSSVLAARWLVLMYQGRWDEALAGLEKFLKADPAEDFKIHALRAKAWILAVKKDYRQAMVVADQLSQAASPNPQVTDKAILDAQEDAIAFVGRLAGFIEGPGGNAGDQAVRAKLEERVLERVDEARKEKFKAAKTEVLNEFQRLVAAAINAKEENKAEVDTEKQKKIEKLSEEKDKLEKDAAKVDDKEKQLAAELKKTLADLDRQDAVLAQQSVQLQGRVNLIASQASPYKANADRLSAQAAREKNAATRAQLLIESRQALDTVGRYQSQIDNVKFEMANVASQRNALQQLRLQAQGGAMAQDRELQGQQKSLKQEKIRNEKLQKRTEKAKATTNGKTLSLETQARSFSKYDSFSLEELREDLLAKVQ